MTCIRLKTQSNARIVKTINGNACSRLIYLYMAISIQEGNMPIAAIYVQNDVIGQAEQTICNQGCLIS